MTDVPSAARDVAGDAEVVYVKHKLFTYQVPLLDENGDQIIARNKRGGERPKFRTVHKQRFEAINLDDLPEDELERGEASGAFFTDAELAKFRNQDEPEAESSGGGGGGSSDVPTELNYDDHESLVLWIKETKPTAAAVVAAAANDPDKAEALLDAEVAATGDQPRKSVKEPLEKIIQEG